MSKSALIDAIVDGVETDYGLPHGRIVTHCRLKRVAEAREICMQLARTMPTERGRIRSFPVIGEALHRHHATVMSGVARITERMATEPELARTVARIRHQLEI